MQFTIQVIHKSGHRELLTNENGDVIIYADRDHAERVIHRLAASDDSGHLYQIIEE